MKAKWYILKLSQDTIKNGKTITHTQNWFAQTFVVFFYIYIYTHTLELNIFSMS